MFRRRLFRCLHRSDKTVIDSQMLDVQTKAFPWPEQTVDVGGVLAGFLFIFLLVFAFQQPTRSIVTVIVREKELRLREYMFILGLSDAAYWTSWWLTHGTMLGISGLLCAIVGLCVSLPSPVCFLSDPMNVVLFIIMRFVCGNAEISRHI